MSRHDAGAGWPECETVDALEARDVRRRAIADVVGTLASFAAIFATWQGIVAYGLATMGAA